MKPAPVEMEVKLEFVDMPNLHCFTHQIGDDVFSMLANTENMKFFDEKLFKRLIEYKWPLVLKYT